MPEMEATRFADGELERRLRVYAGARLSPDASASARMRAAVIERGRELRPQPVRLPFWERLGLAGRRVVLGGLVAVLAVMAGGTAALAASPGGPLYGTRLAIETALLPAAGDARSAAQVNQIDERVGEAGDTSNP